MPELAVTGAHALIWYATGEHQRLGRSALRFFSRADEGNAAIYLPTVVLAEVSEQVRAGRIWMENGYSVWEEELFASGRFFPVELTREVVRRADRLHGIPEHGTRILAATALQLGCPLITPDPESVAASGVVAIW
jgi:PIN domain nuclease of toxin-antitoxin system